MKFRTLKTALAALLSSACAEVGGDIDQSHAEDALGQVEGAAVTPADLLVALSGPTAVNAGATATFQVTAQNVGGAKANSARVDIPLPTGYTPSALTGGCSWISTSRIVRCSFGNMTAGQTKAGSYNIAFPAAAGSLYQRAAGYTTSYEPVTANNVSAVTTSIIGADLAISLAGPGSAVGGGTASFTATVTNGGAIAGSNVSVSFTLPHGVWPTSYAGCQVIYSPQRVRCSVGTLAPGATVTRTVTYGVPYDVTSLNITASAAAQTPEPALTNGNNVTSLAPPVSAPVPVAPVLSLPAPQAMLLTNCFGDPGNYGSFSACDPAWLQSGVITLLDGGIIDTGDPSVAGTWIQPNGPESIEIEFKDATTGDLFMAMDGFGVSAGCFEGLNYWAGETENRGAFQLCVQ